MIQELRTRHRVTWPLLTLVMLVVLWLALADRGPTGADSESFATVIATDPAFASPSGSASGSGRSGSVPQNDAQ